MCGYSDTEVVWPPRALVLMSTCRPVCTKSPEAGSHNTNFVPCLLNVTVRDMLCSLTVLLKKTFLRETRYGWAWRRAFFSPGTVPYGPRTFFLFIFEPTRTKKHQCFRWEADEPPFRKILLMFHINSCSLNFIKEGSLYHLETEPKITALVVTRSSGSSLGKN